MAVSFARQGTHRSILAAAAEVQPGWGEVPSKLAGEFIGTFFLCCSIATAVAHGGDNAAASGAAAVTAVLYSFGYLCGAHFNPVITIALFGVRKCDVRTACWYIPTQILAAFCGASYTAAMVGAEKVPSLKPGAGFTTLQLALAEFAYTFSLATVALHVGGCRQTQSREMYWGLSIGAIVYAGAICTGAISGASFNISLSVGIPLAKCACGGGCDYLEYMPCYIGTELAAAIFAAVCYRGMHGLPPPPTAEQRFLEREGSSVQHPFDRLCLNCKAHFGEGAEVPEADALQNRLSTQAARARSESKYSDTTQAQRGMKQYLSMLEPSPTVDGADLVPAAAAPSDSIPGTAPYSGVCD